jgi:hypothetical protein
MGEESLITAFHRRDNGDGTIDSNCPFCFRTVGSAESGLQLAQFDSERPLSLFDDLGSANKLLR